MSFKKELFILSLVTFVTVVLWIIFEVNHARTATTISPETQEEIKSFDPKLDDQLIKQITENQK